MKTIMIIISLMTLASCSTKQYKFNDFGQACVEKQEKGLSKNITHECLPVDTYEDNIHYHQSYQNEYRKMPNLDDAMDNRP